MSPKKPSTKSRNRLLAAMSADDRALLQPDLEAIVLPVRKMLEQPNKKIENIYFPEQGMASVVGGAGKPNREVEVGIIGNEGMTGLPVIYGNHSSPHQTFIQIAGEGQRLPVAAMRGAMSRSETLRKLCLRYAQAFMVQTTHTAIANARGTIEARLARWVLMAQDRIEAKELPLTHEFLSLMLAVRRPGVTEALHGLTQRGLISHGRGIIRVIDREGLKERANGLYGVPEAEYKRLFGSGPGQVH